MEVYIPLEEFSELLKLSAKTGSEWMNFSVTNEENNAPFFECTCLVILMTNE